MSETVTVKREECFGDAVCTAVLPEIFDMGEDGKVNLIKESTTLRKELLEAISLCPARIIGLSLKD